jgi:hypothetical protein
MDKGLSSPFKSLHQSHLIDSELFPQELELALHICNIAILRHGVHSACNAESFSKVDFFPR